MKRNTTNKITCICLLVGLGLPATSSVKSQERALPNAASQNESPTVESLADKYDSVADQFSAGRFSTRQQATRRVWSMRSQYRDQVKKATKHSDPEVASRARWILDQWRRGIGPDTPANERQFLQGDMPEAIQELIESGHFQTAIEALEDSTDLLEFDMIQKRLSRAITLRFPFYIKHAVEDDSIADLLRLIDMVAMGTEMAVCRIRMMQKLGLEIEDTALLPKSAKDWAPGERELARVSVLTVLGRHDDAITEAKRSVHAPLARMAQMMNGRWPEFIRESEQAAMDAEPNSASQVMHWTDVLFAANQHGDQATKQKAIEKLSEMELPIDSQNVTRNVAADLVHRRPFGRRWKALAMNGRLQEVTDMLKDFPAEYTSLLIAASRPEIAIDALGYPIDQIDSELDQWIDDAIADQKQAVALPNPKRKSDRILLSSDSPCFEIRRLLSLARCLNNVGRTLEARRIVDALCQTNIQYTFQDRTLRDYTILGISSTAMRGWIPELAVFPGEKSCSLVATWCVANKTLSNMDDSTFSMMMAALQGLRRSEPFDKRFAMLCELLDGRIPSGFDPAKDFQRLYDQLVGLDKVYARAGVNRLPTRVRINRMIVDFFASHGQAALAQKGMNVLALQDPDALYDLAVEIADSGEASKANLYFDIIWDQSESAGRQNDLMRFTDQDATRATKTQIAKWVSAQRMGDQEQADVSRELIQWTLCSPSIDFLSEVASELASRGETKMAKDTLEVLLPLAALEVSSETDLYDVAYDYVDLTVKDNSEQALHWFALAFNETYEDTRYASMNVTLPMMIQTWALESAIDSGNSRACEESLNQIMQLDHLDINVAEELLPKMREAGMDMVADKFFAQVFQQGKEHSARFPQDSRMANNIAWVAAMNHRSLEEALVLSKHAVYFEPDSPIYRDTLAEILFQLDRKKEALQVEESCLLDDPGDWHTHVQVNKYREAVLAQ